MKQEIIRKNSRRKKYRSTREKGTIDMKLKSSYTITSKAGRIKRIPTQCKRSNKRPTELHFARSRNIKISELNRNSQMAQPRKYMNSRQYCF